MEVTINGIKVDTRVLRDTSSRMRNFNDQLYDVLTAAKRKVNDMQTNATWLSPAGAAIIEKMNALEPQFQQQRTTLGQYCTFLTDTASQYETAEGARRRDVDTVGNARR